jgi:hypothetical protein
MPTLNQSTFNQPATDYAVAYKPDPSANWARTLAPPVHQDSKDATFKVFSKADWFRNGMQRRGNKKEAAELDFGLANATTRLDKFAAKVGLSDEDQKLWPLRQSLDKFVAEFLQYQAILSASSLAAQNLLTAGVGWSTELVGAASATPGTAVIGWSLPNSTPLVDITDVIDLVRQRTGKMPNFMGASPDVLKVIRRHSDFTNYTSRGAQSDKRNGVVSFTGMEDILNLAPGSVTELGGVYNSAAPGQAASMRYLVAETLFIGYVEQSPTVFSEAAAYTFIHNEIDGLASSGAVKIDSYRKDELKTDFWEAELFHDVQLVSADAGALFTSVLT